MKNTFSTLFYLKDERKDKNGKAGLYLRITANGRRTTISMHRKIDPEKWDSRMNKLRGKGTEVGEISNLMTNVRHKVYRIQNKLFDKGDPFTAQDIKDLYIGKKDKPKMLLEIFNEHNKQMKKLIDIEFALGTYKRYFTTRNHISEYLKTSYNMQDIPIRDVNLKFIRGFEYFLKEIKVCNHNSALKYVNNFKKIIRIAVGNEWITKDPFYNYKIKFKTVERDYLSQEEIDELINKEIKGSRLSVVRDMFVFCCYTGLSYIDIQKLTDNNIVMEIDGALRIQANRTKTKSKLGIPLLPPALAILEKYKKHPKVINGDCLIPVLSNQKSNAYLKEIAEVCGIKKNLTTHLARHTFATTVTLSNGVPIETVGKLLGHKNLRTTQHYAKIIDRKVNEDMKILQKKMATEKKNNKDLTQKN
ncbi:site-specific integrase [Subsaximicrobium wynnwilliamsii]|uniref:Site-specific integrase n=1 Tax=Subsaximicrobium wynnwilliamsii TaxID=291179 RepID=A0A5C6ZAZ0_9FLAO|nr:site-specific integrase [Subsaximicrobium wynnwilliamsii]TXD82008.1 site-specific integrase [Subsaximicrobium wynnwilliamsii]TXD86886.1 site-specific integrase [Subsaximicrobium wynnwilliamsii]TXE01468.1 site-specific integrase [Subsaximicrobium wynnwilliamsii]